MLEIRIGLESLIAGVIDDDNDNGLIILICLGINGDVGVTNRIEFEFNKRITRGVISCVV